VEQERAAFEGELADLPAVQLLQTLVKGRQSGVARFETSLGSATVWIRNGEIVDAEMGRFHLEDAVRRLLAIDEGTFQVELKPVPRPQVIRESSAILLGLREPSGSHPAVGSVRGRARRAMGWYPTGGGTGSSRDGHPTGPVATVPPPVTPGTARRSGPPPLGAARRVSRPPAPPRDRANTIVPPGGAPAPPVGRRTKSTVFGIPLPGSAGSVTTRSETDADVDSVPDLSLPDDPDQRTWGGYTPAPPVTSPTTTSVRPPPIPGFAHPGVQHGPPAPPIGTPTDLGPQMPTGPISVGTSWQAPAHLTSTPSPLRSLSIESNQQATAGGTIQPGRSTSQRLRAITPRAPDLPPGAYPIVELASRPTGADFASGPAGADFASRPTGADFASRPTGADFASRPTGAETYGPMLPASWPDDSATVDQPTGEFNSSHLANRTATAPSGSFNPDATMRTPPRDLEAAVGFTDRGQTSPDLGDGPSSFDFVTGEAQHSAMAAPAVVGRYEVLLRIARGGMGTVYMCRVTGEGGFRRLFALKVIRDHLSRNDEYVRMLLQEARIASRLHHPNVVGIVDIGMLSGQHYLVMDYVEGCTFSELLKVHRKSRPPELLIPIILDALTGLHAAHTLTDDDGSPLTLVHCDFSPQNMLVGINGICMISDFGISRAADALHESSGITRGKPGYLAPEQALGQRIDHRADIFSAGVVLWNALTGESLFAADSPEETLEQVLTKPVPPPSTVGLRPPACFDAVCLRALERDPEDRFQSAQEMLIELRRIAITEDLLAPSADIAGWVSRTFGHQLEMRRQAAGISTKLAKSPGERPGRAISVPELGLGDEESATHAVNHGREDSAPQSGASGTLMLQDEAPDRDVTFERRRLASVGAATAIATFVIIAAAFRPHWFIGGQVDVDDGYISSPVVEPPPPVNEKTLPPLPPKQSVPGDPPSPVGGTDSAVPGPVLEPPPSAPPPETPIPQVDVPSTPPVTAPIAEPTPVAEPTPEPASEVTSTPRHRPRATSSDVKGASVAPAAKPPETGPTTSAPGDQGGTPSTRALPDVIDGPPSETRAPTGPSVAEPQGEAESSSSVPAVRKVGGAPSPFLPRAQTSSKPPG